MSGSSRYPPALSHEQLAGPPLSSHEPAARINRSRSVRAATAAARKPARALFEAVVATLHVSVAPCNGLNPSDPDGPWKCLDAGSAVGEQFALVGVPAKRAVVVPCVRSESTFNRM